MRNSIMILAVLGGITALAGEASACSIRGQYCGYASWAANAFEGRHGFKGNPAILTNQYPSQTVKKVARKRK